MSVGSSPSVRVAFWERKRAAFSVWQAAMRLAHAAGSSGAQRRRDGEKTRHDGERERGGERRDRRKGM